MTDNFTSRSAAGVPWEHIFQPGRRPTDSFTFLPNEDGSLPLRSAVFQAIGAASVQWEDTSGTGVFQSERANEIGEAVMAEIDKAHAGLQGALNNGAAKNAELHAEVERAEDEILRLRNLLTRRTRALHAVIEQKDRYRDALRRTIDAAPVSEETVACTDIHDAVGHEVILELYWPMGAEPQREMLGIDVSMIGRSAAPVGVDWRTPQARISERAQAAIELMQEAVRGMGLPVVIQGSHPSAGTHGEDIATYQGLLTNKEIEEAAAWEEVGYMPESGISAAALETAMIDAGGEAQLEALAEVAEERARQDAKWGRQDHPNGTGPTIPSLNAAEHAQHECDYAFRHGVGTWRHILAEEVAEAFAESEPEKLRRELIQVAAVAVAWAEAIDRAALETAMIDGGRVVPRSPIHIEITSFRGAELSDETLRAVQAWHNRGPQA